MRTLNLLIKPASGQCNMRCRYCFYADETEKRAVPSYGTMTPETMHRVLENALRSVTGDCTLMFQGGEPTLAGLPFFRSAAASAHALNKNGCRLHFALQTNGLLLDEAWAQFLAEQHFLVGVSLDGPRELHDANRVDAQGNGTFARVMDAIRLLEAHGVETNILTVLTKRTARSYRKMHAFYARSGFAWQQYIPCLDPLDEPRGGRAWSLTPPVFEEYLKTAFDLWYDDAIHGHPHYHRYFDNLLFLMNGQAPEACGMLGRCGMQYVVEADGSVYPCDFYVLDRYRLGNLAAQSLEELDAARARAEFLAEGAQPHPACAACEWYALCRGGCRRDRDFFTDGIQKNYYCEAYRAFFAYAAPRLRQLHRMALG